MLNLSGAQVNKTLNLDSVKEAGSAASSGGHQTTVDVRALRIKLELGCRAKADLRRLDMPRSRLTMSSSFPYHLPPGRKPLAQAMHSHYSTSTARFWRT